MFHVNVLEKSFGKVNPLPSAHFMRVGLFPFFTLLAILECSYVKKTQIKRYMKRIQGR
jgi:hypothetical protein